MKKGVSLAFRTSYPHLVSPPRPSSPSPLYPAPHTISLSLSLSLASSSPPSLPSPLSLPWAPPRSPPPPPPRRRRRRRRRRGRVPAAGVRPRGSRGTVQGYDRHVFLRHRSPEEWAPNVEAAAAAEAEESGGRLPAVLAAALKARKGEMKKKTRLTIINGQEGTESSNGDVLIFPDMIKYRYYAELIVILVQGLTQSDVNDFIEEVLVKETQWLPKKAETLKGSYIYDKVFVSPCSHIGGHKYAGNVIIFSPSINGEVTGHWYGYVAPEDVIVLLEQHIGKGQIIDHLWSKTTGDRWFIQEEQKTAHNLRLQPNNDAARQTGCCGGSKASNCCQAMPSNGKQVEENNDDKVNEKSENIGEVRKPKGTSGARKTCSWFERWERQDTYAALAVVAAVASIAVAYSCYKQMK
uniref:Uncharacterized protein n=1 Tax=Ananas comosus var. bracteatus TaxID=296719 RepID=A0A6V7NWV3_ANACO|nr:unnamed protein product [Ananas comosus var. bracteatus]